MWSKRFSSVIPKEARFHREQAERCRALARMTDHLRRQLDDMAGECDDRAREIDALEEAPRLEKKWSPSPFAARTNERLTFSIKDATVLLGLGRTTIYKLIGDGQLDTVKIGNRTLIKTASIQALVDNGD